MNSGKLAFWAPVALMRRSMSACISSQMAYPHGRMTMVPRAGPFSASSARATTSWYHWGKSFPWGVSTALLATAAAPPRCGFGRLRAYPAGRSAGNVSAPGSEQGVGEVAAVAARQRVVIAEEAEDVQHQLAGVLAALARALADGGEQLGEGLLGLAVGGLPRGRPQRGGVVGRLQRQPGVVHRLEGLPGLLDRA